jgi:hypothetical protein
MDLYDVTFLGLFWLLLVGWVPCWVLFLPSHTTSSRGKLFQIVLMNFCSFRAGSRGTRIENMWSFPNDVDYIYRKYLILNLQGAL